MSQIWIFLTSFTRTILVITTNFPDWNFSTCFYFWKHRVYFLLSTWVILFTMLSYIIFHKAIQWLLSTLGIKSKVFSGYLNLHEQAPASVLILFSSFFLCSLHSSHTDLFVVSTVLYVDVFLRLLFSLSAVSSPWMIFPKIIINLPVIFISFLPLPKGLKLIPWLYYLE